MISGVERFVQIWTTPTPPEVARLNFGFVDPPTSISAIYNTLKYGQHVPDWYVDQNLALAKALKPWGITKPGKEFLHNIQQYAL